MPIIKSAKKALRQSEKRRRGNTKRKNEMKSTVKLLRKLVAENKKKDALKLIPQAYKSIDKAAKRGVIKKNAAGRKKSRLTKMINAKS